MHKPAPDAGFTGGPVPLPAPLQSSGSVSASAASGVSVIPSNRVGGSERAPIEQTPRPPSSPSSTGIGRADNPHVAQSNTPKAESVTCSVAKVRRSPSTASQNIHISQVRQMKRASNDVRKTLYHKALYSTRILKYEYAST